MTDFCPCGAPVPVLLGLCWECQKEEALKRRVAVPERREYNRAMDGGEVYAVERLDGDTWVPVCAGSGPHGQERVERLVERERKRDPDGRYRATIARTTHAWEPK